MDNWRCLRTRVYTKNDSPCTFKKGSRYIEVMDILKDKLKQFVSEREWDQFHNPKNLVLSLISETGELAEIFRWLTLEECDTVMRRPEMAERIKEEMADVFNNLLLLAMKLDVDLLEISQTKLEINAVKYPTHRWKGRARQV